MNIEHLKTFITVAQKESFSAAARELYTTPTALTQQVNALERKVGFPLFTRDYRGATLTRAGDAFLPYAQKILALMHEGECAAREAAGFTKQVIKIGTYRDIETVLLQHEISDFQRIRPDVELSLMHGDYRNFLDQLRSGAIDLYVSPWDDGLDKSSIGFQKIGTTRLCCSMAMTHPLASKSLITMADLAGQDVIIGCGCTSRQLDELHAYMISKEQCANVVQLNTDDEVWTSVLTRNHLLVSMSYAAHYFGGCASVTLDWPQEFDYGFIYRLPLGGIVGQFLDHTAQSRAQYTA